MDKPRLLELADRIESALDIEDALRQDIQRALGDLDLGEADGAKVSDLDSTDELLKLVNIVLPGWTISLKGKAWRKNGHWMCSLRKTTSRDSDEFIGVGRAPTLPHALLGALFRVLGQRAH